MRRSRLQYAAYAVLCLLLPSCLPSKHPLSDATQAQVDPRLQGTWINDDKTYYHVGTLARTGFPKRFLQFIGAEFSKNGTLSLIDAIGFSTKLGEDHYLNIVSGKGSEFDPAKLASTDWQIFKYRIDGDRLDVWMADFDFMRQEIKDGKIHGELDKPFGPTLSDPSQIVAAWVVANAANIFKDKDKATFKRVPNP